MPHITVQMWTGRTTEQKAAIAEAFTKAMVEIAGNTREKVNVVFYEIEQANWAIGGTLSEGRPHNPQPVKKADPEPTQPTIAHTALRFADIERAEKFYCETLGFGVRTKQEYRDGNPAVITQAGVGLVGGKSSDTLDHIAFYIDSLADAQALIEREGLKLIRGPIDMPYGRSVYIEDPEGNEVELIEVDS